MQREGITKQEAEDRQNHTETITEDQQPDVVVYTCKLSIQEAEAGVTASSGQPELHREMCLKRKKNKCICRCRSVGKVQDLILLPRQKN